MTSSQSTPNIDPGIEQRRKSKPTLTTLAGLAPYALDVLGKYEDNKAMASIGVKLEPTAESFLAVHASVKELQAQHKAKGQVLASSSKTLAKCLGSWSGVLAQSIPGYSRRNFPISTGHPDRVLDTGKRMLELLESSQLSFAADMKTEVEPLLGACNKAWTAMQDVRRDLAHRQELARNLGKSLDELLVNFRRIVKSAFGAKSWEYRVLLPSKGRAPTPSPRKEEPLPIKQAS